MDDSHRHYSLERHRLHIFELQHGILRKQTQRFDTYPKQRLPDKFQLADAGPYYTGKIDMSVLDVT